MILKMKIIFLFFLFLCSINSFADSKYYGIWSNESEKGTKKTLILKYVSTENKQHDILSNGTVPCYGFLQYSEGKNSPITTYLISECEEKDDHVRLAVIGKKTDYTAACHIMLQLQYGKMVVSYDGDDEDSIGSLLAGLTLNHSATEAELIKSEQVFSRDRTSDSIQFEKEFFWYQLITSIIALIYFFSIFHMIYELFIRRSLYNKKGYTLEEMKAARVSSGKPEQMSGEEYTLLNNLIAVVDSYWIYGDYGILGPKKYRYIKKAEKVILKMAEMYPTDQKAINIMNDYVNVLNSLKVRKFSGSGILITAFVIIFAMMFWQSEQSYNWPVIAFSSVVLAIYYGACLTPLWVLNKRGNQQTKSIGVFASVLAAMGLGSLAADGSYGVSRSTYTLLFLCVIALFLAMLLPLWSVINYIRNYIIYR